MKFVILALGAAGVAISLFNPLKPFGDTQWGPGFGDLLNGTTGILLLLLAGAMGVIVLARKRRAEAEARRA
ncbi:MAG: hypothetical protein WAT09_18715 [Paracoccaceae bacterium]